MATKTTFLGMTKPENNEYQDTWDEPTNKNWDLIDSWAKDTYQEIFDARFGKTSLKNFLLVGHNTDGSLKPTPEAIATRNSFLYGDETSTGNDFEMNDRLEESDKEIFAGREGSANLRANLGLRDFNKNEVVQGAKNVNGYPAWLGYTGVNVQVDGSVTPIWMKIYGYMTKIRNIKQVAISGGAGLKYLYAEYAPETGELVIDGDSTTPPPATATGTIGSDGSKIRIFEDLSRDFTSENVQVGDVLEILGTSSNAGKYLIAEVAPDSDVHRLKIKGVFSSAGANVDYNIWDSVGVTLGFDTSNTPVANRFYFGEADWDGVGITAVRAIHFNDTFIGEWRAVDLTSSSTFLETWNHNLFDDALEAHIQVSSSNSGTAPIEELHSATLTNSLAASRVNTLLLTPSTPQVLSGDVTVSLTGDLYLDHSAQVQWTKYQVSVKNPVNSVFYRDFSGALKQTGYVRVILSKVRK